MNVVSMELLKLKEETMVQELVQLAGRAWWSESVSEDRTKQLTTGTDPGGKYTPPFLPVHQSVRGGAGSTSCNCMDMPTKVIFWICPRTILLHKKSA